ncbi:phosphatase PAP2 family protein [uncultured Rhodoblastus sp.]|uniref:phosphatase PAP2 family protein n=1 Tax=uncultured Rhodoblastus sp. TaxID=543037 RepID=UPI0025D8E159|nr:phosphatase PAP2 family protein [uncultured Rhodoblastus sp.]
MKRDSVLFFTASMTVACLAMFAAAPEIDLLAAAHFFDAGHFIGRNPAGDFWRRVCYDAPYLLLALLLVAGVARWRGRISRGPSGRAIVFLLASLALGPGLLVNGLLKEHSHRPRPEQTLEFGGPWRFRPFEAFDGACQSNCSFVSGEVATSAWTLAPALLAPPPLRAAAVGAALLFTAATAALRMAFGGHYLSDAVFAALFTFLIVLVLYRWYLRAPSPR